MEIKKYREKYYLTTERIGLLNDARERCGFNVFSYDVKVLYKVNNEAKFSYD